MSAVKVSDLVARFLAEKGAEDIFLVSGGGIMHLLDSIGRQKGLRYICNYHEQACAIAAQGWAKVRRKPGVCVVTVGPGGINALSGVVGAWMESTPMLVLSGQVRRDLIADYTQIRQKGPQEADVVGMAAHVCKSAITVKDPLQIRAVLEQAWHLATSGRPGPVWVDLPLDVQGAMVEENDLAPTPAAETLPGLQGQALERAAAEVAQALASSRRPLLLIGNGVAWAGATPTLHALLDRTGLPVALPPSAKEALWESHPSHAGTFGTAGQRRGNLALQSADLVLAIGVGLSINKTGFNPTGFAARAKKISVDIDAGQLTHLAFQADVALQADAKAFLEALLRHLQPLKMDPRWKQALEEWRQRFTYVPPEGHPDASRISAYALWDALSDRLPADWGVTTGNGLDVVSCYQCFRVKEGQRVIISGNWGAMGWDLPVALGISLGLGQKPVALVTGDGSLQWNVQEWMTLAHHHLPVLVFVLNNGGYASIRSTQRAFFESHFVGSGPESGVVNPDFKLLAAAYGVGYSRLEHPATLLQDLDQVLAAFSAQPGPHLVEVITDPGEAISPKASAFRREDGTFESRPLEDMAPFLPREEIATLLARFDDESHP
jgi:acetolactate synthase-1/2/3 large subunit